MASGGGQANPRIFSSTPVPVIRWTEDGKPLIAYGTTDPTAVEERSDALVARDNDGKWRFFHRAGSGTRYVRPKLLPRRCTLAGYCGTSSNIGDGMDVRLLTIRAG